MEQGIQRKKDQCNSIGDSLRLLYLSIAKRCFPKEAKRGDDSALTKLLKDYLLKDEDLLHAPLYIEDEKAELTAFLAHFESGMKKIFQFFATNATNEEKELGRHIHMEDGINLQTCSMKWSNFLGEAASVGGVG